MNPSFKTIKLANYKVYIGSNLLENIQTIIDFSNYSSVHLIADSQVRQYSEIIKKSINKKVFIIEIEGAETSKSISSCQHLWGKLLKNGCDRKSLIINIGGGVVGDLGGFVASTYMRGVDFVQIPTTLLAQVDASVGGKVGINFKGIKNLIGSFNQPLGVVIDVKTLETLPAREFISGFAEIIKHGLVSNKKYFDFVTSKKPLEFSQEELVEIIFKSCQIKAAVVESDQKELGQRKILNFGHTIGHALETLSQKKRVLLHGEAIALGVLVEGLISQECGFLSKQNYKELVRVLENANLITSIKDYRLIKDYKTSDILSKIKSDKKNTSGVIKWVLLKDLGLAVYDQEINPGVVKNILRRFS